MQAGGLAAGEDERAARDANRCHHGYSEHVAVWIAIRRTVGYECTYVGIDYESIVDHPLDEVFAWHTRPGRHAAVGAAVAADDGGRRDEFAGRRPGGARTARRTALGGPARSAPSTTRRIASSTSCRRTGRGRGRRGSSGTGATPTTSDEAPGRPTRVHDRVDAPVPAAALRSTFVYRHRQLADDLAAHRDAALRGPRPARPSRSPARPGLVGSALTALLTTGGHRVIRLVRRTAEGSGRTTVGSRRARAPDLLDGVDAVVHLAGTSIAGRFTAAHQAAIRDSRIEPTRRAGRGGRARRPTGRGCSSAHRPSAYYGYDRGDEVLSEDSDRGDGFLADVVADWEAATAPAADAGLRVVAVRTGIVQAARGGTLQAAAPAVRRRAGRPARQWRAVVVVDRHRRPDRRLLPRAVRRAAAADRSTRWHRTRCATATTPRRWPARCTGPRCCPCRRSGRDCCWASRVLGNSPRPTSGCCRPSCERSVTGSGSRWSRTRWPISWVTADCATRSRKPRTRARSRDAASACSSRCGATQFVGGQPRARRSRPSSSSASHSSSSGASSSGWNCRPSAVADARRPAARWRCGRSRSRPAGRSKRSKCHWNHGPAGIRSGARVLTSYQPISGSVERCTGAAERLRDQLAAEAHAEHRRPRRRPRRAPWPSRRPPSSAQSRRRRRPSGRRAGRRRRSPADRETRTSIAGSSTRSCGHDVERVDVVTAFGEHVAEHGLRCDGVVVDEEDSWAPPGNLRQSALLGWRLGGDRRGLSGASSAAILRNSVSAALT